MPKTSYMGNGSSTEFTFNFPYYENTDIIVTKNCSTATGYTIVGTSAGLNADIPYTGGKVVFDTAPTATDSITISRSLPLTRCVDYQPTERLNPTILNQDFNYLMEVIKDRKDELDTLVAQYSDIANKESTENLITKINTVTETINDFDNEIENGKIMSKNDFYSYTTNCITEIPQDIKLELNNGTLTLKAGSKIYIPNGSNVFTVINIANDLTVTDTSNRTLFIGVNTTGTALLKCVGSETGSPVTGTYKYYYDSTANKCYQSGASSYTQVTFPIAIVTATSDGGIVSIDRIFNGFGYIGSTFFVLPGLTALAPSGRNADGSLNQFGQMMAGKLYNESPYAYGNIVNGFANPKDIFNVNANLAQAEMNNQSAWDRARLSADTSRDIAQANIQQRRDEYETNHQLDIAKFYSDVEYRNAILKQNEQDRWSKSPAGQAQGWAEFATIVGVPKDKINDFVVNMVTSQNSRGNGNSENNNSAKVYTETIQMIGGQFIRLQNALERGDMEKAQEILTGIDTLASDMTFKNLGVLVPDDMKYIDHQLNIYGQVIKGEITLDKAKELLGRNQTSSYKGGNDQAMAEYQNNPRKLNDEINAELARRRENKNAEQQQRQIADKAAQIQNEYGRTGIYQNPNPDEWEMPQHIDRAVKTPRIRVDASGNRIITNWAELSPEQRTELHKNGYNGGVYYAGRQ